MEFQSLKKFKVSPQSYSQEQSNTQDTPDTTNTSETKDIYCALPIIYEDNHLLVVEKKAGYLSQSDGVNILKDTQSLLQSYLKEKYQKPGNVYLGLVHRLDRPVAGLMVFAKTSKAAARLSEEIRKHQFEKIYLCLCEGNLLQDLASKNLQGTSLVETEAEFFNNLELQKRLKGCLKGWTLGDGKIYKFQDYLIKDPKTGNSRVVLQNKKNENANIKGKLAEQREAQELKEAKEAVLTTQILAYNPNLNLSLCLVKLKTGRHHQIRVQFATRSFPLLYDHRYGKAPQGKKNIALYALKLGFRHPTSKEFMSFTYLDEKHDSLGQFKKCFLD